MFISSSEAVKKIIGTLEVILHKLPQGYVDLTLPNTKEKIQLAESVTDWMNVHGLRDIRCVITWKSSALRICVPVLDTGHVPFEDVPVDDIEACFRAIKELSDLTGMIRTMQDLAQE